MPRHSTPTTPYPTRATTTGTRRAPPPSFPPPAPQPQEPAAPLTPVIPQTPISSPVPPPVPPPVRPRPPRHSRAPPRSFPRTRESRLRTASNFRNATPPNPPRRRGATPPIGRPNAPATSLGPHCHSERSEESTASVPRYSSLLASHHEKSCPSCWAQLHVVKYSLEPFSKNSSILL